ncbi:MAG: ABC transporter permease [Actinomycetota bacterium]|nr:ABC transporter permease [Actinomycetota bacterium]
MRYPRWFWTAFGVPGLLWLGLLFLVPLYVILAVAMGTVDPIFLSPVPVWNPLDWSTGAFEAIFEGFGPGETFFVVFVRTFGYVAIAVALSLAVGYPVAYFIARHGGRFKGLLLLGLVAPFWISYLMRMLAWVNLLQDEGYVNRALTALGVFDAPRNWLDGRASTVILGLVYGYVPFLILPLYAALDRIPRDLIEASRDLGASPAQTFRRVTLPLSKPGILAGTVIIALPMFGDYYTPDLLSGSPRTNMIGNQINLFIHGPQVTVGAALVVVLMLMLLVLMAYYLVSMARAARELER